MEIYYKKHIKAEDDLPIDGEYIVHQKNSGHINDMDICREGGSEDAKEFETKFWTNSFDWYLENIDTKELQTPIEDGLYATGRFTQDECSVLADGLFFSYMSKNDSVNINIHKIFGNNKYYTYL